MSNHARTLEQLFALKRQLVDLRHVSSPQREVFNHDARNHAATCEPIAKAMTPTWTFGATRSMQPDNGPARTRAE